MKPKAKLSLFESVDIILWEVWDPIGINDCIEARDEYQGYVPSIVHLLRNEADSYKLEQHLLNIEHANMGLASLKNDSQRTSTVRMLLDAYFNITSNLKTKSKH